MISGCQPTSEVKEKSILPFYDVHEIDYPNTMTFSDFTSKVNIDYFDYHSVIRSRSFMIAENFIQSIYGGKTLEFDTKYYFYEKYYVDLKTYNFCFINQKYLRNGGFPCVEIDPRTGCILRVCIAGNDISDGIYKVVPHISFSVWDSDKNKKIPLAQNNKAIQFLGSFCCSCSFGISNPPLWIEEIRTNYDWIILNAIDFVTDNEVEILSWEGSIYISEFQDREVGSVIFTRNFKGFSRYAPLFDMHTGQMLGWEFQE